MNVFEFFCFWNDLRDVTKSVQLYSNTYQLKKWFCAFVVLRGATFYFFKKGKYFHRFSMKTCNKHSTVQDQRSAVTFSPPKIVVSPSSFS